MGLHLELHGLTVHLIFIHSCGTKKRAMTGKTRTQLAFSLLSWLMLPPSSSPHDYLFLFSLGIKSNNSTKSSCITSHPHHTQDLAHLPSRSSFSSSSLRLDTCMNQYIHPQSFTDIMLIIPKCYHCYQPKAMLLSFLTPYVASIFK